MIHKTDLLSILHYYFDFSQKHAAILLRKEPTLSWAYAKKLKLRLWPRWQRDPLPVSFTAAESLWAREQAASKIRSLRVGENDFLSELRNDSRVSPILYYCGNLDLLRSPCICVVGTRTPSSLGIVTCRNSIAALVLKADVITISGLARGIDYEAHKETLRLGGKTIAVIGSGLTRLYPREHSDFLQELLQKGNLVLTPFPAHCPPLPSNFPRRNYLMAALALGTVCIEGSPKSGSLITGKDSLGLGKTTCVFPQDYQKDFGKGAIELIRLGAEPVADTLELLEKLAFTGGGQLGLFPQNSPKTISFREGREAISIEEFAVSNSISLPQAIAQVEELCVRKKMQKLPNGEIIFLGKA